MENIEFIYKEELISEISNILVSNGVLKKDCVDSTAQKYIRNAESAIMLASGLDKRFTLGNGTDQHSIFFSRSFAKLFISFVALKQEFPTFEIISRSTNNEIIHRTSKEKFSQAKTPGNMSHYSPEEYMKFKNRFDYFYSEYITENERKILKKYLKEYNIDITVAKFNKLRNFLNEVAEYITLVIDNYKDAEEESIEITTMKIKDEKGILSGKSDNGYKMGNFFEKVCKAMSKSIKHIYLNELGDNTEVASPTQQDVSVKSSTTYVDDFIKQSISKIDNEYNEHYIPREYITSLSLESKNENMNLHIDTSSNNFSFVITALFNFINILHMRYDIEGIQYFGADVVGIDYSTDPESIAKRYQLDKPTTLITAYTDTYRELVRFDDNTRADIYVIN